MATKKKSTKKSEATPKTVDCELAKSNKKEVTQLKRETTVLKKEVASLKNDVKKSSGGDDKDLEKRLDEIEKRLTTLVNVLHGDFSSSMLQGPEGLARKLRNQNLV